MLQACHTHAHSLPGSAATSSGLPPCLCSRKFVPLSHDCRAPRAGPAGTVLCHPLGSMGSTMPPPVRSEPRRVFLHPLLTFYYSLIVLHTKHPPFRSPWVPLLRGPWVSANLKSHRCARDRRPPGGCGLRKGTGAHSETHVHPLHTHTHTCTQGSSVGIN